MQVHLWTRLRFAVLAAALLSVLPRLAHGQSPATAATRLADVVRGISAPSAAAGLAGAPTALDALLETPGMNELLRAWDAGTLDLETLKVLSSNPALDAPVFQLLVDYQSGAVRAPELSRLATSCAADRMSAADGLLAHMSSAIGALNGAPAFTGFPTLRQPVALPRGEDVLVFSGEGTTQTAARLAEELGGEVVEKDFHFFGSTGEHATFLLDSPRGKHVVIVQETPGPGATLQDVSLAMTEAMQAAHTAKSHGARSVTLVQPERFNPVTNNDSFSRLAARLAGASGVNQRVFYGSDTSAKALESANGEVIGFAAFSAPRPVVNQPLDAESAVVFSGAANPDLGHSVADELGGIRGAHTFTGEFPSVNLHTNVRGRDVVIVSSTRQSPQDAADGFLSPAAMTMEAMLLAQSAQENGARSIRFVFGYMMGARSDALENFVGSYAQMSGNWFTSFDPISTTIVTPHEVHTPLYYQGVSTQFNVVDGLAELADAAIKDLDWEKIIFATPDLGATKRTRSIAKARGRELLPGVKHRDGHTDKAQVDKMGDGRDLSDWIVLVPDDEVGTGGTLRGALQALGAPNTYVLFAHNNMAQTMEQRIENFRAFREAGVKGVYVLDTHITGPLPPDLEGYVRIVSSAPAIVRMLKGVP